MNSIITLKKVKKEYQLGKTTVTALQGVDLDLEQGKYYSIIGPSGSGKSSLLHIIGCMDLPSSGEVSLNGMRLNGLKEKDLTRIRGKEIGFIFQAFHLNPILTVRENVAIALRFLGINKKPALQKADACLKKVGLSHRLRHYPSELSGGERQRVAIARAIVKKPALILADEPTGNLDSKTGQDIIGLLKQINREENTTIVQVTHDMDVARISDIIVTLRDGQIVN
jgi:putative ABC transport system ATP-binding protein